MWDFKIAFDVPRGFLVSVENEPRRVGLHQILLRSLDGYGEVMPGMPDKRHGGRMLLTGSGYKSESEAEGVAVKAAYGLLLASLRHGFGISFTSEAWCQYAVTALISEFKRNIPASVVLMDNLGVEIFKHNSFRHEISAAQGPRDLPIADWLNDFQNIYTSEADHSSMAVPLIILNEALGERSITSRLLLSVTAIEAIAGKRKKRSKEEIRVIDSLIAQIKASTLGDEQKESLKNSVSDIKRNSISKTCRELINEVLGEECVIKFKKLYDIRSKLVHEGAKYPLDVLHEQAYEALKIATALIHAGNNMEPKKE